jgi:hypothetical protein
MVIEEVLSWFAFYSSPIPDQTGHSKADGLVLGPMCCRRFVAVTTMLARVASI